ncbi:MAG TPA: VOC family protein [Rhodothermales bacterium]|nr:VOC family protein [Rhodothermales bacterium]
MITHIKTVGVYVSDQQKALDFYTNVLGFEVLADEPMGPDARWIEVAPPGATTNLALWTPPGMEDRIGTFTGLVFQSDDIEATHKTLQERGVEFVDQPKDQPGGVMGTFKDPDGNTFVLRG